MERRRYLGRSWGEFFKTFSSKVIQIEDEHTKGYAAFVKIDEVTRPYIVGDDTCIADNGYSTLTFMPDGENYCMEMLFSKVQYPPRFSFLVGYTLPAFNICQSQKKINSVFKEQ